MASLQDVRQIALALPEVEEVGHFGAPSFRVGKSAFAVLRETGRITLKLDPEDQHNLVAAHPSFVVPVSGGSRNDRAGREGWSYVDYEACDPILLASLLKLAWSGVAPRRLLP